MEIPLQTIFLAQKLMIAKCNLAGKPVVTATQMLESMTANPRPTRAEATDVANAVLDGTDAVMLSGETAAGKFPIEACSVMVKICLAAESSVKNDVRYHEIMSQMRMPMAPLEAMASSAVSLSAKLDAAAICVLASSGETARMVSKFCPSVPVLVGIVPRSLRRGVGFSKELETSSTQVARQLLVTKHVKPVVLSEEMLPPRGSSDDLVEAARREDEQCINWTILYGYKNHILAPGDSVVCVHMVAGVPIMRVNVVPDNFDNQFLARYKLPRHSVGDNPRT